jgi:hypothetical protein
MFIGHYAVGLALKGATPRTSLGWLAAAPQLPDLLWPIFLLIGWERVSIDPGATQVTPLAFDRYPYSHSLLMVCGWGLLLGALYLSRSRHLTAAVLIGLAVVSHWVLDWVTHVPDLPLVPWSQTRVGLGLWNSLPATVAVEFTMYAAGLWCYVRATRPRDRQGQLGFAAFAVFLLVVYVATLFGPPPPDVRSVAFVALLLWLLPLWAAWFDRHRVTTPAR